MRWEFRTEDAFLFEDDTVAPAREGAAELHGPVNGSAGVYILIEKARGEGLKIAFSGPPGIAMSAYSLMTVPVDCNTADEEVYGFHVFPEPPEEKPAHCLRKAPYRVYEPMRPAGRDGIPLTEGRAVLYVCFDILSEARPGLHTLTVCLTDGAGETALPLSIRVYGVSVPREGRLSVTNWFSLPNMASYHGLIPFSPAHLSMIREYARLMRRARQTHFFLTADLVDPVGDQGETYRFDRLKAVMDIFWDEGFRTMEFGYFGARRRIDEPVLTCPFAPETPVDSPEGFRRSSAFIKALAAFLREEGAEERTIFHIADEPDVPAGCIPGRLPGYLMLSCLLRRYIPGARVVEAVKSTAFRGGIDIYVPLSRTYEGQREEFDRMKALGAEIWFYVCCCPGAGYLNRLLDRPLLDSRLLFWAAFRYGLSGYLHWGFNQYEKGQDPFVCTSPPHAYGNGVRLPAGDGFLVYPRGEQVLSGVRLEAQRRGACDYELLCLLSDQNPEKARELAERAVESFQRFITDPEAFQALYRELLAALEDGGASNNTVYEENLT